MWPVAARDRYRTSQVRGVLCGLSVPKHVRDIAFASALLLPVAGYPASAVAANVASQHKSAAVDAFKRSDLDRAIGAAVECLKLQPNDKKCREILSISRAIRSQARLHAMQAIRPEDIPELLRAADLVLEDDASSLAAISTKVEAMERRRSVRAMAATYLHEAVHPDASPEQLLTYPPTVAPYFPYLPELESMRTEAIAKLTAQLLSATREGAERPDRALRRLALYRELPQVKDGFVELVQRTVAQLRAALTDPQAALEQAERGANEFKAIGDWLDAASSRARRGPRASQH